MKYKIRLYFQFLFHEISWLSLLLQIIGPQLQSNIGTNITKYIINMHDDYVLLSVLLYIIHIKEVTFLLEDLQFYFFKFFYFIFFIFKFSWHMIRKLLDEYLFLECNMCFFQCGPYILYVQNKVTESVSWVFFSVIFLFVVLSPINLSIWHFMNYF